MVEITSEAQNKVKRMKRTEDSFITSHHITSKSSYTMIRLGLFQECKDSSIYANQSM